MSAVARTGLYISRDAGNSWTKAQAGLPGGLADALLARPDFWLVSMQAAGLYISRNEGATWTRVKPAKPAIATGGAARASEGPFPVLATVGATERIYAGSANDGLYLLDFSGDSTPKSFATGTTRETGGH